MTLDVALQEWSSVCAALGDGRLTVLVRKGGIHERGGGLFAPEHDRFLLWPTRLHEAVDRLRPGSAPVPAPAEASPGAGDIRLYADVASVARVTDLGRLQALGDELVWTDAELATRFHYRDKPFLFVLLLRVFRLPHLTLVPDHPSYAGCRSWLRLQFPVPITGAVPVLDDATFARRRAAITAALAPA